VIPHYPSIQILHPDISRRVGRVRHALFDFDGTLSVIREGWEGVMIPYMLDCIGGGKPVSTAIEAEVREYIDYSTGILTIKQMEWLAEAVRRFGLVDHVKTARAYKAGYVQAILQRVRQRQERLRTGQLAPDDLMIGGARAFLDVLVERGVALYLASGTDHEYVVDEAACLGIDGYFGGKIYGALDGSEANDKELVLRRILEENQISGGELLVVGDGPVEIRIAAAAGATALGVASDEVARRGWNESKVRRLTAAGADLLIPDFLDVPGILALLFPPGG